MRSPWLSRQYKKIEEFNIEKAPDCKYVIFGKKTPEIKLEVSEEELVKFLKEDLNEIEWEKYFFRGLAEDVNSSGAVISSDIEKISGYKKNVNVRAFRISAGGKQYIIVINPEMGSWVAMTEEEFERFNKNTLSRYEWESLFIRGLAKTTSNMEVELDTPPAAEFPSVVVVNITTNCNLRCKYCFASCGDFVGENMSEEVMLATIKNMYDMPAKMITFEFQGGEASLNDVGIRKFIELAEKLKEGTDKIVKYRTEINCIHVSDLLIDTFKKYNVSVGISLDGPKEMNDKYRVDIKGNGSFDKIMGNYQKLIDNGISIDGSVCTIGQHNCHFPKEIMKFFDSIKLSFKPRPINVLGREKYNNLTTKPGEWAECFRGMYKEKDNVSIDNFSFHINEENVYSPVRDYICLRFPCGAARELISVNPNGEVYPCDGFKGEKEFLMGNLLHESLREMLQKEKVAKLKSRTAKDIPQCKDCLFRGMCCSCCYSAYGKFGSIYREDPHCADKRQIYIHLMQQWLEKNVKD